MWIDRILSNRTTNAVSLAAQFAEQRHRVLVENTANLDTPDWQSRRLDPTAFQSALREALDRSASSGSRGALVLRGEAQVSTSSPGRLLVHPQTEPAENALFHDGTNARLEGLMADVAENSIQYELATNMLRTRFDGLLTAIRGRTS